MIFQSALLSLAFVQPNSLDGITYNRNLKIDDKKITEITFIERSPPTLTRYSKYSECGVENRFSYQLNYVYSIKFENGKRSDIKIVNGIIGFENNFKSIDIDKIVSEKSFYIHSSGIVCEGNLKDGATILIKGNSADQLGSESFLSIHFDKDLNYTISEGV